jgi:hypothetical protein
VNDGCGESGLVQRRCLPNLVPDRYKKFVGSGDGTDEPKVEYQTPDREKRMIEPGELDLCRSDRLDCALDSFSLKAIKNIAESSRVNTDGDDGTIGNGRRHVIVAAMLTWEFGEDRAREILEAHENIRDGVLLPGQEFNDYRMVDLINNEIGISIGRQFQQEHGSIIETAYTFDDPDDPASGFYSAEMLSVLEDAVLSEPTIVYFKEVSVTR